LIRHFIDGEAVLRAGGVGTGAFGRHHAAKYAQTSGVNLAAIADANPDTRRSVSERYGAEGCADWHCLAGKVDLVSVCSPAVTHGGIVRALLEANIHVLVEKPIATTLEEADALIRIAKERDLVLTVGHQERFVFARSGLLEWAKTPREIQCWRLGPWTGRGADVCVVLDLMIHDLDLMHRLVPGKAAMVAAQGTAKYDQFADDVRSTVAFDNGTMVRLHASRMAAERRRGMRLVYDDGVVEIDFITREIHNTTPRPLGSLSFDDPLGASVAGFVAAVRGTTPAFVRPEEARTALETALRIKQAMQRPARIPVTEGLAATA
jgi:predicted dehydrogenase